MRRGFSGQPLTPLYSGPYEVLQCGTKSIDITASPRVETVSTDWIKPTKDELWWLQSLLLEVAHQLNH
jgi:hypothetical protein